MILYTLFCDRKLGIVFLVQYNHDYLETFADASCARRVEYGTG